MVPSDYTKRRGRGRPRRGRPRMGEHGMRRRDFLSGLLAIPALVKGCTTLTPVPAAVTVASNPVSGLATPVIARRVYRVLPGGTYQLLAEITDPNISSIYIDGLGRVTGL